MRPARIKNELTSLHLCFLLTLLLSLLSHLLPPLKLPILLHPYPPLFPLSLPLLLQFLLKMSRDRWCRLGEYDVGKVHIDTWLLCAVKEVPVGGM